MPARSPRMLLTSLDPVGLRNLLKCPMLSDVSASGRQLAYPGLAPDARSGRLPIHRAWPMALLG